MSNKPLGEICNYDKCTGCALCESICPQNAISMNIKGGFYRPEISNKCVGCMLCKNNCPARDEKKVKESLRGDYKKRCYAAWDKNEDAHFMSSSGGIATLLARYIVKNGGFVIATKFDSDKQQVGYVMVDDLTELEKCRGSKYVNSKKENLYKRVYNRLMGNACVALFVGVPCEVYAMKSFMCQKGCTDRIFYIDLLCRGGASPLCFEQHIKRISKNRKLENVSFRGGENDCKLTLSAKGKLLYLDHQYADPYFGLFMKHVLYQPACFDCSFAGIDRCGDITLGDYWGLSDDIQENTNGLGCNFVLINSTTGEEMLSWIQDDIECYERPIEEAVRGNTTLQEPTAKVKDYERFWNEVNNSGFHKAAKKIYGISYLRRFFISNAKLRISRLRRKKHG